MVEHKVISECIFCNKPLGADTKNENCPVCLDHRLCPRCNQQISRYESAMIHEYLNRNGIEITIENFIHIKCMELNGSSPDELANVYRLMIEGQEDLDEVTNELIATVNVTKLYQYANHDSAYLTLKKLEACVAQLRILVSRDEISLKQRANQRETRRFEKAQLEALTSSRPVNKRPDESREIEIGTFMKEFDVSRERAKEWMKLRANAIKSWMQIKGITESQAIDFANKAIRELALKNDNSSVKE